MRFKTFARATALVLLATLAAASGLAAQTQQAPNTKQVHYAVISLGTLGGTGSVGESINNKGSITGAASLPGDSSNHAALWRKGQITDLGTLGGPNSRVVGGVKNTRGEVAGGSETSNSDPLGETFCSTTAPGFSGQPLICLGFVWRNGVMTPLPTLGGNNSFATGGVNRRGQIVGTAENSTQDPACPLPQVLDFEAVIWGPEEGQIRELPPFPGDSVAIAYQINDRGQAVGVSGLCSALATLVVRAVRWQDHSVTDLGNLGSTLLNFAYATNERGQVVGASGVTGDTTFHAFLWENGAMTDLGTLPGDFMSQANGINNKGQVVGLSCIDQFFDNCHAVLWQDGTMTDLNDLILPGSSLSLVFANDINDRGEIVGFAFDSSTGDSPGFLAIPCDERHADDQDCRDSAPGAIGVERPKVGLPESARERFQQRRGFRRLKP